MHNIVLVLACLACAGHGLKLHTSTGRFPSSLSALRHQPMTLQDASNDSSTLATFLLALHPAAAAFAPARPGLPVSARARSAVVKALPDMPSSRRSSAPWMIVAQQVFRDYYMQAPYLQRKIVDLPASVSQYSSAGVSAAGALLGYLSVPAGPIGSGVGAYLGSRLGSLGGTRLLSHRQKALLPAVAACLAENMAELSEGTLYEISVKCGVDIEEVQLELGELYGTYFQACIQSPGIQTAEISQLKKLKKFLNVSSAEVGEQVFKAAQQISSKDQYPKFIFLAECILSDDDPEGYEYEAARCQKELALQPDEWLTFAEKSSLPFYQKAINSAVIDGKACTSAQLQAVKTSLRIRETRAEEMHKELLERFATSVLSASGRFTDTDKERLLAAQTLLGSTSTLNLQSITLPNYMSAFKQVLSEIGGPDSEPDENFYRSQIEELDLRRQDLMLEPDGVQESEENALRAFAKAKLEAVSELLVANDVARLQDSLQSLSDICVRLSEFMALKTGTSYEGDEALIDYCSDINEGLLEKNEVDGFYRLMVQKNIEDGKLVEGAAARLSRIQNILGIYVADAESIYQNTVGPLLRQAIEQVIAGDDFDPSQKTQVQGCIANLALPELFAETIVRQNYGKILKRYSGEDKDLTDEQAGKLADLRDVLGISEETMHAMHEDEFGATYSNAVREMLDVPGEIEDEAYEDLEEERKLLGISPEIGKELFALIVNSKLEEHFKKGYKHLNWESKSEKKFAEDFEDDEEDEEPQNVTDSVNYDEDLRPFVVPFLDMIDYATRCKAFVVKEVDGKMVNTVAVNLADKVEPAQAIFVYRNFLSSVYQSTNQTISDKLFGSLEKLALLLDVQKADIQSINDNIGKTIYDQYMKPALAKGRLSDDDLDFLESIREDLSLSKNYTTTLVRQNEFETVKEVVDFVFAKEYMYAGDVEKALDVAELHKVDLKNDLKLAPSQLETMFEVLVEDLINTSALTADDLSPLQEYIELLHLGERRSMEILSNFVEDGIYTNLVSAYSMMENQFVEEALQDLNEVIKFASAHTVKLTANWTIPERQKSQLFMLHAGQPPPDGVTEEEYEAQQEILKRCLGLEDSV